MNSKKVKHEIELQNEGVHRTIGDIPSNVLCWSYIVIFVIFAILVVMIFMLSSFTYKGESLIGYIMKGLYVK